METRDNENTTSRLELGESIVSAVEAGESTQRKIDDAEECVEMFSHKDIMKNDEVYDQFQQYNAAQQHYESTEIIDQFVAVIKHQTRNLSRIVSLEYGLLDKLVGLGVLTSEQVERVEEHSSQQSRIVQFVEELTSDSEKLKHNEEQFFRALDRTQHKHVSNFVRSNGIRSADFGNDWPLIFCDTELTRLDNYRDKFVELVDARNGLLDIMFSDKCINNYQQQRIETHASNAETNKTLFGMLRRGSLATYNTFIRCLLDTKQPQVVSLLAPHLTRNVRPLSELQQSRLQTNYDVLLRYMDTKSELLTQLYAADCITERQKEYIETAVTQTESNKRLVEIMRRGSEEDFNKFIECLKKTDQQHVSRILLEDGVAVPVIAHIAGTENLEEDERQIIDKIKALVHDDSNNLRLPLCETVIRLLTELRNKDIEIVGADEGSIALLYFCKSLRGLHYLHDLYDSDELTEMMQELFIALLNSREYAELQVTTLQWSTPDYNSCVRNLRAHLLELLSTSPAEHQAMSR